MELVSIPQPELEKIEQLGGADLVIGMLDSGQSEAGATVAAVRESLAQLSKVTRALVVYNNGAQSSGSISPEVAGDNQSPAVFSLALPASGQAVTPHQSMSHAYRGVFAVCGKLGVRACGVIASQPWASTAQWISRLVQPVLELGFDLVAPHYTRSKMEGLLNRSVLSPLCRALYGLQLQNPLGPDFGLSGTLLQGVLKQDSGARPRGQIDLVASIASTAARGGCQVSESHLGVRTQPLTDWMNLSSLLAEVLGPIFLEMERQAAFWQSVRGSKPVPRFGSPDTVSDETVTGTADVRRMIESFQLGAQNLQDVWELVLPPTTLLELRKLARLPAEQFRLPDELWARIVYDFALGHRLRTISRDHLLRSLTPLYLGAIASYALEMESAGIAEIEAQSERVCRAFEAVKPYLVSRWRWPDRFNP